MRPVALIHFSPPELYPPVMNFINCRGRGSGKRRLDVYTTWCYAPVAAYIPGPQGIRIRRYGAKSRPVTGPARAWHYFRFYFLTLWSLVWTRPDTVIYFETFSAFPAYVYKRFFNRRSRLFIHYHEYMTPVEYAGGMLLVRWFHRLEKKLYGSAQWVSHTNAARMDRFINDLPGVSVPNRFILPNYPPAAWQRTRQKEIRVPVKAVYVGALSLDTMYVREFADWLLRQDGAMTWDIYSLNITAEAEAFIGSLPQHLVKLHPGVSYTDLPDILSGYDVGLILYTGHILNWVDNAPNKLFEYLSCGLDVWFPAGMTGSLPYVTKDTWPRVLAVDFRALEGTDPVQATERNGLRYSPPDHSCEAVYKPLWEKILNSSE